MSLLLFPSMYFNNQIINVSVIYIYENISTFCVDENMYLFMCLVDHGYPSMVELDTSFHITI